jgi:hypothetical protein
MITAFSMLQIKDIGKGDSGPLTIGYLQAAARVHDGLDCASGVLHRINGTPIR